MLSCFDGAKVGGFLVGRMCRGWGRRAAKDGRDGDAKEGIERRPSMAATRTRGTREREERPSMAATRTRGKGTKGGRDKDARGRRAEREGRDGDEKGGQGRPRLKTRGEGRRRKERDETGTRGSQGRPKMAATENLASAYQQSGFERRRAGDELADRCCSRSRK